MPRTHEGDTRYVKPGYVARHRAKEGQAPGFTYGLVKRWVSFEELLHKTWKGPRYLGLGTEIRAFFETLHKEDVSNREYDYRIRRASTETVSSLSPVSTGRHHLREDNQWPTAAQALAME